MMAVFEQLLPWARRDAKARIRRGSPAQHYLVLADLPGWEPVRRDDRDEALALFDRLRRTHPGVRVRVVADVDGAA